MCDPQRSVHEGLQASNLQVIVAAAFAVHGLRQALPGRQRHGRPDARPQTPGLARAPEHVQVFPRSHVAHAGDAARREVLHGGVERAVHGVRRGRRRTRSTRLMALSFRIPVGSPDASRTIAPPATSGVLLVTWAAASAREFARLMCSSRRLTHTGFRGVTASIHSLLGSSPPQFWWSQSPPGDPGSRRRGCGKGLDARNELLFAAGVAQAAPW